MSKVQAETKVENQVDQAVTEKKEDDIFAQEEEPEQYDESDRKALQNLNNLDMNAFTKEDNQKASKKASNSKKNKTNKGQDFIEYAQKNGINYNIQYEDNKEKKQQQGKTQNYATNTNNNQINNSQNKPYNTENKQINGNKKNKKQKRNNYNTEGHKPGVNKFDSFNYNMMMYNPYMYSNMNRPEMFNNQSFQSVEQDFQKISIEDGADNNSDKNIVDALNYYFSIENLNKDYFIRSKLDEEGYLEAEQIINFKKMKLNSVTIEKIQNILEQFQTTIETKVENDKLYLRNLNWETIKDKLTPLEQIPNRKKQRFQNNNYVNMQNNYYYNLNPQIMYPQNMVMDPYMAQQMAFHQMNMMGYNQYQNSYQSGFMPQNFQQNTENHN